jgi:carbonic anhydrase
MPEFRELIEGYRRFRRSEWQTQRARWAELAEGQAPAVMVIGCCDSRVDPATIFDTHPGQVFALRVVANLVPPYTDAGGLLAASSAIEFAVTGLEVKHVVVLGHARCGGVAAALEGGDKGAPGRSFVDRWMSILAPVREQVIASDAADKRRALELAGIKVSLGNLRSFPFVAERERAGRLKLHGAYFAIETGELTVLDESSGHFLPADTYAP